MPRQETSDQARKSALESDYAPLYAVAGLTDALTEALRGALAERQDRARKGLSDLQSRGPALQRQAMTNAEELRTFVITLPEQFKHLPEATKTRIAELQAQANDLLVQATATYAELAGRGKLAVDDAVHQARGLSDRAEQRADDLREEAGDRVDPLLERAQESVTQVRKTVSGRTATKTVTPRSSAKGAATRKVGAAKQAAEQGEAIKRAAAERATPPKKTAAKKSAPAKRAPSAKATATAPAQATAADDAAPTPTPVETSTS